MDIAPGAANCDVDVETEEAIDIKTHNQYHSPRIFPTTLDPSPLAQFHHWFAEALNPPDDSIPQVKEPEAMCISTATADGVPSSRFVLLKHVDSHGFVFFTNYDSRKSKELLANPYASIAFYWKEVSRQIRVVGKVEKVAKKESEDYFASRPRGSKIGAWASQQSKHVGEDELQQRVHMIEERFPEEVPCPEHWGGWRIVPS
jgi:pyridoxamine-phosphate oxidase